MASLSCGMMIAAVRPQRTSAMEKLASSAAITTSQAASSPVPPPKQAPCTSAMVGTGAAIEPPDRLRGGARDGDVVLARGRAHGVDPFEIGAGLEMPAAAADDDGAQPARFLQRIERRQQRLDQLAVIGVVALRPVETTCATPRPSTSQSTGASLFGLVTAPSRLGSDEFLFPKIVAVMPALVSGIHVLFCSQKKFAREDVDGRNLGERRRSSNGCVRP